MKGRSVGGSFWHYLPITSTWVERTGSFQSKLMMALSLSSSQNCDGPCHFFYLQMLEGLVREKNH